MPVKVSVVVPVYNPGPYLRRCFDSVVGQSLPDTDYEVIFVDDGSTDGSASVLDELATTHGHVRVVHQANSGWPGQPRNVGIDAAIGDFVFFVDHDDVLGPQALERLHDFASRNGSDIAIGKVVAPPRAIATAPPEGMTLAFHALFARTREHATLWDAPIIDSLTPHKLFRRAFLREHGLRFPEGRRRLEDHVFVLSAYFAASVISVLGDPICYVHFRRPDHGNASATDVDPAFYYRFVREVIGIVEANTEPGPRRDALLQRFARVELVDRLQGPTFLALPASHRATLFEEVRSVVADHIPPTVDALLNPLQRIQLALVRAGRLDLIVDAAKWREDLAGNVRGAAIRRQETGSLECSFQTNLLAGRHPLTLERRGDHLLVDLPRALLAVLPEDARAVPTQVSGGTTARVRRRSDAAELSIPTQWERRVTERQGHCSVVDTALAAIPSATFETGSRALPASWDVIARIDVAGMVREARVARLQVTGDHRVVISRNREGHGGVAGVWLRRRERAVLLAVSRHMDPRLRRRLQPLASRIVGPLDP